ncbi:TetR family transcriptional regulator [Glutamicibacter uratoxydans]|uniref:TetR family transcriptional regulator n=1 Tax=Glutamicibacter uratoxydans TaxID=43667 RepID=A0A4Y4DLK4_GLUUR|nr:TetR/AcrR family transcriptional regulator [Glutamicibacter uratoxydans]GED05497.1 TetR family transcriptional regulator [Glutamicibacter uratoxydans]
MSERKNLTQRRKAATELEIAKAAAALFARQGIESTTVENIADQAGISLRTFYRYFPTKEESLAPLLQVGAEQWQKTLRNEASGSLRERIDTALATTLDASAFEAGDSGTAMHELLALRQANQGIEDVWQRVNTRSEHVLAQLLQEVEPDLSQRTAKLWAAAATCSIRLALEDWAEEEHPGTLDVAALARENFAWLGAGIN